MRPRGVPTLEVVPGGERFTMHYTLEPYAVGEAVPVAFAALEVSGARVEVPPAAVAVRTTMAEATAAAVRPLTGAEDRPAVPASSASWPWALVAVVVVAWLARRLFRSRAPRPLVQPNALDELAADLDADRLAQFAPKLADGLRQFIEATTGLPAPRRTASELGAHPAATLLQACDGAKFAGRLPDANECRAWLAEARRLCGPAGEPSAAGEPRALATGGPARSS